MTAACGAGAPARKESLTADFARLDGGTASFADYRGTPVVVNFFSSTCVPCLQEMPAFEKVHQQLGTNVAFVGMDVQDTVTAGQTFVAAVKVTWDIGRDPDAALLQSLGGIGLPTPLLVDRSGVIVFRHVGALGATELMNQLTSNHLA